MSTANEPSNSTKIPSLPKTRSPNYPACDLKTAIERRVWSIKK